jgi:hypothetical protein
MDEDLLVLEDINSVQERKNLRTILNRGRLNKFELDEFLAGEEALAGE